VLVYFSYKNSEFTHASEHPDKKNKHQPAEIGERSAKSYSFQEKSISLQGNPIY
jgi:hypothetical protein